MGRPSKLTPAQWADVERRLLAGETARAIGRDVGVSEAAIRKRFGANQSISAQSSQVRTVAEKLADANTALEALPIGQRAVAVDLADKLRSISQSLAAGAELGARNFHRLSALANTELQKVDDADPASSEGNLKSAAILTKMANDAAATPINLLSANKDRMREVEEPPAIDSSKRAARLAAIVGAAAARRESEAG
jgi:hypothetical protein